MTDAEIKEHKSALQKKDDVAEVYEKRWPDAEEPCLHPCRLFDTKVIKALTALMRQAMERGTPATAEELNEVQDISPESWLW